MATYANLRRFLQINSAGIRRVTVNGREFIVARATSINPGVLNGSRGPLYYPPEECGRNPRSWDGVPVTVNHPFDPATGSPLPANADGVWDRQGIGHVKNTHFDGKLRKELWLDVEKTRAVDKRILNALESGQPLELSTGLYTDNEEAPQGATHNGRSYTWIARNYRPDHLAILPDQKGACSVEDGCGVLVNAAVENCGGEGGTMGPCPGGGGSSGELLGVSASDKKSHKEASKQHYKKAQELTMSGQTEAASHHAAAGHLHELAEIAYGSKYAKKGEYEAKAERARNRSKGISQTTNAGEDQMFNLLGQLLHNADQVKHQETGQFLNKTGISDKQAHAAALKGHKDRNAFGPPVPAKPDQITEEPDEQQEEESMVQETRDDGRNLDTLTKTTNASICPGCGGKVSDGKCECGAEVDNGCSGKVMNGPYDFAPSTPHDASKGAAGASVMADDPAAPAPVKPAMKAVAASKDGKPEEAAAAHDEAAAEHEAVAKKPVLPSPVANAHNAAAGLHRMAAKMHRVSVKPITTPVKGNQMTRRQQNLAALTANCTCQKTRAAFNQMSDEVLNEMVANNTIANGIRRTLTNNGELKGYESALTWAEDNGVDNPEGVAAAIAHKNNAGPNAPDSSFASTRGTGEVQAGGEEDETETGADFSSKVAVDAKGGEKKMSMNADQVCNALFGVNADAVKQSLQFTSNAMTEQKQGLVRQILAHVSDPARKKQLGSKLMTENLDQLRERVECLPLRPTSNGHAPANRIANQMDLTFLDAPVGITDNAADDLLESPTMDYSVQN